MVTSLTEAASKVVTAPTPARFWFLTGQSVPEHLRVGKLPEQTQVDHFASRLDQVSRLDGASRIKVDDEAIPVIQKHSAAMANAIDQMRKLQDGEVSVDTLATWAVNPALYDNAAPADKLPVSEEGGTADASQLPELI